MGEPAEEPDWQERALCAQTDPEAFFPEKGGSTREAKRICSGCEVRAECLEYALAQRRALRHLGRALGAGAPPAAPRRRLTLRERSGGRGPERCRRRVAGRSALDAVHRVRLDVEVLRHLLDQHLVQQVGQVRAAACPGLQRAAVEHDPGARRQPLRVDARRAPAGPAAPRRRRAPRPATRPRPARSRRPRARRRRPGRDRSARRPTAARSARAPRAPSRRTARPGSGRRAASAGRAARAARGRGGPVGGASGGAWRDGRWSPPNRTGRGRRA